MFPHGNDDGGGTDDSPSNAPPPVNGDNVPKQMDTSGAADGDVVMTDANTAAPPAESPSNHGFAAALSSQGMAVEPSPPEPFASTAAAPPAPLQTQDQQPSQPPLGRMASAGDSQPRLAERQDSVGVRQPAAFFGTLAESVPPASSAAVSINQNGNMGVGGPPVVKETATTVTPGIRPPMRETTTALQAVEATSLPPPGSDTDTAAAVATEPPSVTDAAPFATQPTEESEVIPPPTEIVVEPSRQAENTEQSAPAIDGTVASVNNTAAAVTELEPAPFPAAIPVDPPATASAAEAAPSAEAVPMKDDSKISQQPLSPTEDVSMAPAPKLATTSLQRPAGAASKNANKAGPSVMAQQEGATSLAAAPTGLISKTRPATQPPVGTIAPPTIPANPTVAFAAGAPSSAGFGGTVAPGGAAVENGGMHPHPGAQPGVATAPRPPGGGGPFGGMKELRVEDALLYLDDVKREFGDRPRIYNEFLAIMKNFKSQEVDTPGVIARVSKLFRGYNNLILGFNKFLPDGFKISMEDLRQQDIAYAREQEILRQQQAAMEAKAQQLQFQREIQGGAPAMGAMGVGPPGLQNQLQSSQQAALAPSQQLQLHHRQEENARLQQQNQANLTPLSKTSKQSKPSSAKARKGPQQIGQPQPPQQQQPLQHQAVEFDHAISYVTTIKRRFANDPGTYHAFLEILHTYQKEQRGIKEVLEQVAHLFQDHPDLLKEFTFFLPDAVQEQAKERLHRAAAESESRLSALRAKKQQNAMDVDQGASQQVIDMTGQSMLLDAGRGQKRSFGDVLDAPTPIAFPQTPEVYVYNSAVERQFFDAAKEALASYTRDGGQAWAEFMKCLDMYAQEILSRSEMLNFVEPLLGKRNNKLFEEFKRILAAAGGRGTSTAPPMEDSWYSVPLSEIDFSRCRRCSPSYRALPRDYPAPPCSQRSDEESKVLNDVWVSLPVGSEESYTFRHMRRNTYEETLFRVEDERFEIDMAIDSNLCTLALLEPFAEEMAMLSVNDLQTQVDQDNDPKPGGDQKGLGGKYFRYTFDPKILGVIHRNSITRIYAEQGPEMLELLKNNPSVAIPIVVRRLRQKDEEWRRVRDRLNRHWKELAENNYYKSLDHRSLTWRTTDKRAISTRTLISEIKDRAANEGNEGHAALQARIDKAKEEHGSFYEVTMAKALRRKLDLSNLPKPDRRLFTPHMSFIYENNSWVQRDAYRILSFALERGSISPTDKERCHRLWTEFLGPWFSLSLNWMLSPAVNFLESSSSALSQTRFTRVVTEDDGSPDEEDSLPDDVEMNSRVITEDARGTGCDDKDASSVFIDHHPLPVGSTVSTLYGEGRVLQCRKEDGMYEVKLPLGNAFLRPSAVLCSILSAEKSAYTTQRRNDDRTKLDRPDDKLVIGTQGLYLFFRLHQILCRRLGIAKRLAYEVKHDASLQTLVEQMPGNVVAVLGRRRYDAFLALVYALLDGGTGNAAEGGKYEDRVRSLLGHGGYELATMDKLISHILKNIQSMANDDTMWSLVQLFRRHADAGGFKPEALRQEAAYLSDGEQMYAFQVCPVHKDGGDKSVLYMEYLGVISGSEDEDGSLSEPAIEPLTKRQKR